MHDKGEGWHHFTRLFLYICFFLYSYLTADKYYIPKNCCCLDPNPGPLAQKETLTRQTILYLHFSARTILNNFDIFSDEREVSLKQNVHFILLCSGSGSGRSGL